MPKAPVLVRKASDVGLYLGTKSPRDSGRVTGTLIGSPLCKFMCIQRQPRFPNPRWLTLPLGSFHLVPAGGLRAAGSKVLSRHKDD
jgi:hypothetical protein